MICKLASGLNGFEIIPESHTLQSAPIVSDVYELISPEVRAGFNVR
jgi:hypothetical protein